MTLQDARQIKAAFDRLADSASIVSIDGGGYAVSVQYSDWNEIFYAADKARLKIKWLQHVEDTCD